MPPRAGQAWDPERVAVNWPTKDASRAIARRRQLLYDTMRDLEATAAMASGWPGWRDAVDDALTALRDALSSHVEETEGPDGLFHDVIDKSPRMAPAVQDMEADHVLLLEACDAALASTGDSSEPERVRRFVNVLLGRLASHRQKGAEMLYEAFMTDIGAGD